MTLQNVIILLEHVNDNDLKMQIVMMKTRNTWYNIVMFSCYLAFDFIRVIVLYHIT